jgi:hypothetical protein
MNKKILVISITTLIIIPIIFIVSTTIRIINNNNSQTNSNNEVIQNQEEERSSCMYQENTYTDGESFPSPDSCNTCTCDNGIVSCTEKACTIDKSFKMVQPQQDSESPTGISTSYQYKLNLNIPTDTQTDLLEDDVRLILHSNNYSLSFHSEINYVGGEFEKINDHALIQNSPSKIYRITSIDPYILEAERPYLSQFSNIYYYSSRYSIGKEECPFLSEGYEGCGDYALFPEFTNTDDYQLLFVTCGVNSETDAEKYCDEIVKSISVEKIL